MTEPNLFKMLSAYRPGTGSTPFDTYCTQALAYFALNGSGELVGRLAHAAGVEQPVLHDVRAQARVEDAWADLLLTFDDHRQIVCEVQTDPTGPDDSLVMLEELAQRRGELSLVLIGVDESALRPGWALVTWPTVADALSQGGDRLAGEFAGFIRQDILGIGPVTLDEALTTNRFYAMACAAIRRKFGLRARCVNTASQPMGNRYRYMGTSFALDGGPPNHWIGLVNEAIPLSEHYDLMLASKERPLGQPAEPPRTTADWRWPNWTTGGRVVRPIAPDDLDALLARFPD